jgi:hypothetical protein
VTDYSEQGAVPVEDAAVADPPTGDEVLERQRVEHPEKALPPQRGEPADAPSEPPAVVSPGDSDAPDAPDADTVYPDEKGVPGEA